MAWGLQRKVIDFSSNDEVVFTEAADCVGGEGESHGAPVDLEIGMMALCIRDIRNFIKERAGLTEVLELERPQDLLSITAHPPPRYLLQHLPRLLFRERRNAAFAGFASLRCECLKCHRGIMIQNE